MQLRPKWTGRCKLEGNFTIWFPVTGGDSKRRTDHHFHLCVFLIRFHFSAHSLYNPSSAEFSFSSWKAGLQIGPFVCSDRVITPLGPTASVLSWEKVQTPLNFQWWMQKNLPLICLPMLGRASWSCMRCLGTWDHWTLCQDRSVMMNMQHLPLECSAWSVLASVDTKVLCKWYIGLSGKFENVSSILLLNFHPRFYLQNDLNKLVSTRVYNADREFKGWTTRSLDVYTVFLFCFWHVTCRAMQGKKSGINDWEHLYMTEDVAYFFFLCSSAKKKKIISIDKAAAGSNVLRIVLHAQIIDCCCTNSFCLLSRVLLTLPRERHHQNSFEVYFPKRRAGPSLPLFTLSVFTGVFQLLR